MRDEIALPGGATLRRLSFTGNDPWEIEVEGSTGGSSHPISFGYQGVGDALVDYVFRFRPNSDESTHNCRPDAYRSSYARIFWPLNRIERQVKFHASLLSAIEAVQEAQAFTEAHGEYFADQGAGIHRWSEALQSYEFEYGASGLPELLRQIRAGSIKSTEGFDVLISHASEDKDNCVRPLALELSALGLKVWYDEFELNLGDSLRRSIDRGIATSRNGIIILSTSFMAKNWPQYELDGIVARMVEGQTKLIPVWFEITKEDVLEFSPTLADRVSVVFERALVRNIALKIASSLARPN